MSSRRLRKTTRSKQGTRKRRKWLLAAGFLVIVAVIVGVFYIFVPAKPIKVQLQTTMGNITIQLQSDMPITTGNFVNLVKQGTYDGTIFHRVIENFMIQGGDPTGTGYGDPSIPNIQDEFTSNNFNNRGTIAMANAGPNTGSSQFFINVVNNNYLDTKHPVFGTVVSGMDVADAISKVARDANDKPLTDVKIIKAEIIS
jgi:peptidylprolyl isomerase